MAMAYNANMLFLSVFYNKYVFSVSLYNIILSLSETSSTDYTLDLFYPEQDLEMPC